MLICDGGRPGIATDKRLSFGMFRIEFLPTSSYSSTSIAAATGQLIAVQQVIRCAPRDGRQLSVRWCSGRGLLVHGRIGCTDVVDRAVPQVRTGFGSAILVVAVAGVMPIGCVR